MTQSIDFSRLKLPNPPFRYDQAYMRTLVDRLETTISSRLPITGSYFALGSVFSRLTGTNAAQAITATTNTIVQFNTLDVSKNDLLTFDPSTFALTTLIPGIYHVFVNLKTSGTTGDAKVDLLVNGVMHSSGVTLVKTGADISLAFPLKTVANDVVKVQINTTQAQNLDLTKSSWTLLRLTNDPRITER